MCTYKCPYVSRCRDVHLQRERERRMWRRAARLTVRRKGSKKARELYSVHTRTLSTDVCTLGNRICRYFYSFSLSFYFRSLASQSASLLFHPFHSRLRKKKKLAGRDCAEWVNATPTSQTGRSKEKKKQVRRMKSLPTKSFFSPEEFPDFRAKSG